MIILFQSSILAHPSMKIFFTHCGMHGVMEAIYYGVPMVGMPVFIDQVDVLARMEEKRIGVGLDKWASSNEIRFAVDSVLNDVRWVKLTIYHQIIFLYIYQYTPYQILFIQSISTLQILRQYQKSFNHNEIRYS